MSSACLRAHSRVPARTHLASGMAPTVTSATAARRVRRRGHWDDGRAAPRFYTDLAPWWPLISPPDEYAEEAAEAARHLRSAHRSPCARCSSWAVAAATTPCTCGPGSTMTLVDLSAEMLAVSRRLNPECEHVVGDMRTVRLGRDVRRRLRPRRGLTTC